VVLLLKLFLIPWVPDGCFAPGVREGTCILYALVSALLFVSFDRFITPIAVFVEYC